MTTITMPAVTTGNPNSIICRQAIRDSEYERIVAQASGNRRDGTQSQLLRKVRAPYIKCHPEWSSRFGKRSGYGVEEPTLSEAGETPIPPGRKSVGQPPESFSVARRAFLWCNVF